MKLRDSGGNKRIDVKLNSEDHANNNFSDQLRKPGAILESDPYIRDADDKSSGKSCLEQLCFIFTCSCLQKKNQVLPVNGFRRFEPQPTTSVQNGGHNAMGNGLAAGIKNTTDQKRMTGSQDKSVENSTKNDGKFEYNSKASDARKNLNIYSTETGNFEAGRKSVYTIPVEVNSKDNGSKGTGTGTGTGVATQSQSQSQYPNAKAKENIEKLFKMSDDEPSDAFKSSHDYNSGSKGNYKQSSTDSSYRERPTNLNSQVGRKDNYNGTYPANTDSDFVDHANPRKSDNINSSLQQSTQNYGKKSSTVNPTGSEGWYKSQDNDAYGSNNNAPSDAYNYKGEKSLFGTPHSKNPYEAKDSNSKSQKPGKSYDDDPFDGTTGGNRTVTDARGNVEYTSVNRNYEDRQHETRQKHSELSRKQEYGGGQSQTNQKNDKWGPSTQQQQSKNVEAFSDSHSRNFVDNYRKKDDSRRAPAQNSFNTNPHRDMKNSDQRYENSDRIPGNNYSKNKDNKNLIHDKKKDFSDRGPKFRGEKFEMSNREDKNKTLQQNSMEPQKNYQRNAGLNKNYSETHRQIRDNRQKTSVADRNGRENMPGQRPNDDKKLAKESRQYPSESVKKSTKNEETSILNPARLNQAGEQDYRFSKRPTSKGSRSADSTRKDAARKSNLQNDPKPAGLSKDASRAYKSAPNFEDEFTGSRPPQRIEPLGDTIQNGIPGFSKNRPSLNNYTASTSVHHGISHVQQNDYMALPAHIVNLPDEDMDFASNNNAGIEKSFLKSVPHSKSYENLTHKNGFGDRFKYNSSQQRRQPETKSNNSSSLYPNTLQPFDSPKDALEKCLLQIESPEWEIVMQSLQGIVRLSRHHPEVLVSALHRIVTGLSKQIRSLRSQVTKAACVVSQELFEHLGKIMDPEIEELAPALLSRTFDANKFLQHDANTALDSMIDNVSPVRSATFLLVKGAKHRNAVVRTTACRLLARLCLNLGTEQIYSLPRDTRDSLLNAAAKFLLEGSLETRAHAKELFSVLAREPKFMRLMNEVVPPKTMEAVRKPLIKIISQK